MSGKIKGKIIAKFDAEQVTERMTKREFVVETQEQYPQKVKCELTNLRCDLLDAYNVGDEVEVDYDLGGKEYPKGDQILYFVSVRAWKIQRLNAASQNQQPPAHPKEKEVQKSNADNDSGGDDLPF